MKSKSVVEAWAEMAGAAYVIVLRAIGADRFTRFMRRRHNINERGRIVPTDVPLEQDPEWLKMEADWTARQTAKVAAEQERRAQVAHLEDVELRPVEIPAAQTSAPEVAPETPKQEDEISIVFAAQRYLQIAPPSGPR